MKRLALLLAILPAISLAQDPGLIINGEATVTLTWQPPTQYEDGTLIAPGDIGGYVIYWNDRSRFEADGVTLRPTCQDSPAGTRTDGSCYPNVVDLTDGDAATEQLVIQLDQDVTLYFAAVAWVRSGTTPGDWSRYSGEATRELVLSIVAPPDPPVIETLELAITCTTNLPTVTCTFTVQ